MNVFQTHADIIGDYSSYIRSFISIADSEIRKVVNRELSLGKLWPEPLHPDIRDIFKGYKLYHHQVEAIRLGTSGQDFIVTSGTGSGKSLTYIGCIFHHLLSNPGAKG